MSEDLAGLSERLRSAFREFDEDKTATISKSRLQDVLRTLDPSWTQKELDLLFESADQNHDGVIQYDEWVNWLCSMNPPTMTEEKHEMLVELVTKGEVDGVKEMLVELKEKLGESALTRELNSREYGDRMAKSVMFSAATRGYSDICKVLLEFKADPGALDDAGNTPMHYAADLGRARCVKVLLAAGADPGVKNNFGSDVAHNAKVQSWDSTEITTGKECIQKLLAGETVELDVMPEDRKKMPRATMKVPDGLKCALFKKDVLEDLEVEEEEEETTEEPTEEKKAKKSLKKAPTEDTKKPSPEELQSMHILTLVKRGEKAEIEKRIEDLKKEEDGEKKVLEMLSDIEGTTDTRIAQSALHMAAAMDNVEVLETLLKTKVDPNVQNDAGNTPLHFAADLARYQNVHLLLANGANPRIRNNFGHSASDNTEWHSWEQESAKEEKSKIRQTILKHT
eukprot:gnl/MRDRNA2_/MRDRNA2_161203_c0_seq1.p1 gnl/MRDRNA2_/MRDRNA2_161203_c0~~gnl/MRDRNA2_/MRDRNA2_161203_c0_seq1.p1  ORF type:complete len:477 (+),score=141.86 gnl/MRDRNA2_/MRDRNA2_161203_c0_seq1:73-1431(+)